MFLHLAQRASPLSSSLTHLCSNPGGDKYDSTRFGETATAVPGTTLSRLQDVGGGGSNMSVLSGVVGPYASDADKGLPAATSSSAIATDTSSTSHAAESTANPTLSSVQPGTSGSDWPLTGSSTGSTQPQGGDFAPRPRCGSRRRGSDGPRCGWLCCGP